MFKPKLSSLYLMGAVLCTVVQTLTYRYDPKEIFLLNQFLNLFRTLFFLAYYLTLVSRPGTRFLKWAVWAVAALTAVQYITNQIIGQYYSVAQILGTALFQVPSEALGLGIAALGIALFLQKTVDGRQVRGAAVLVVLHGSFLATYFLVVGAYLNRTYEKLGIPVTGDGLAVYSQVTQWLYFVGLFVLTAPVKKSTIPREK